MKTLFISVLLALPACASAQGLSKANLEALPGLENMKAEAAETEPIARPDSQKIMSELASALQLSSKQEDRISAAINKKTAEFDRQMTEFDRNSAEEKKWRYKLNENRHAMSVINRDLPDVIREFLDEEQRQNYDAMLEARNKPAAAVEPDQAGNGGAVKPVKKRRLIKRRKPAAVPAEDEAGQTMVDKEAPQPGLKKRRVLKKKPARPASAGDFGEAGPAGASPTGQEAVPEEEDPGAYP